MLDEFDRRPARTEDYQFALALYLESTKPLLIALGRWDEETILSRFAKGFILDQIQMLTADGTDIGWIQVSETAEEYHVDQLHLIEPVRDNGIGTQLVQELQEQASASNKPVALNVIRGNRAQRLYERLGFRVVGTGAYKIRMVWRPKPKPAAG